MGIFLAVWAYSFSAFHSILLRSMRNIHELLNVEDINTALCTALKRHFISVSPYSVINGHMRLVFYMTIAVSYEVLRRWVRFTATGSFPDEPFSRHNS